MSSGTAIVDSPNGNAVAVTGADDPYLIEVVAPIESETKDGTLAEIRGVGLPAERATLKGLSDAIDTQTETLTLLAKRIAKRAALRFG